MLPRCDYEFLENLLGYKFRNSALLRQALTHKSHGRLLQKENNERLEFLGDAVLQLVVSNYLFTNFPELREGQLAKIRALLVSQPTLAELGRRLRLNEFLKVGKSEERTGAQERDSLLCDTVEAIYGAIFLDSGFARVQDVILGHLPQWDHQQLPLIDAKSTLQEHFQQFSRTTPTYRLVEERGPDHDKIFGVEVCFQNDILGRGYGRSKKEAAQAAAREALANLCVPVGPGRLE